MFTIILMLLCFTSTTYSQTTTVEPYLQQLYSGLMKLQTKVELQQKKVESQKLVVESLQNKVTSLQNTVSRQQIKITSQQNKVSLLQTKVASIVQARHDKNLIELRGGNNTESGNVYIRGLPVCDDGWGKEEADVACTQLGFAYGAYKYFKGSQFAKVGKVFSMDDVNCVGAESSLFQCFYKRFSEMDCKSGEGAGVWCYP